MNTYPKYKSSGVDWIGDIPEHWQIKKLKYLLLKNDGGVWGNDYDGISKNATKVFRSTEINLDGTWNFQEEPALRVLSDQEKEKSLLQEGDLLVTKSSGSELHIGKTALVTKEIEEQKCCYSNFMQRLRPISKETSKYLHIFMNSSLARDQYNFLSNTTTGLANLSAGLINDVLIPNQQPEEQTSIANFLDEKTAKIDSLIEKKKLLIELLKEERTAIINQAVTKGIDPNVKLKQSGIDWLGEIPQHWELKRLKYLCSITTGSKNTEDRVDDGDYPFFVRSQEVERINSYSFDGEAVLTAGDGVGVAKVFHHYVGKFDFHQRVYCIYDFNEVKGKFIYYYLMINLIKEVLRYNAKSTVDSLRLPMFQNFVITYPKTFEEQDDILQFIESKTKRIDNKISKVEKEIELLQEYRTALISEVVTGKIKVE